mgnify:CR=1 FL=1
MKRPTAGIAIDASTRGNPGPSEYRGVDINTGELLFHVKIGVATNNITEFIALSHAVLYAIKQNIQTDIYTDSITAISWLRKKTANSNLQSGRNTQTALDYLSRIEKSLKDLDISKSGADELLINARIYVLKWYTSEWGEIPADFGLKNQAKWTVG